MQSTCDGNDECTSPSLCRFLFGALRRIRKRNECCTTASNCTPCVLVSRCLISCSRCETSLGKLSRPVSLLVMPPCPLCQTIPTVDELCSNIGGFFKIWSLRVHVIQGAGVPPLKRQVVVSGAARCCLRKTRRRGAFGLFAESAWPSHPLAQRKSRAHTCASTFQRFNPSLELYFASLISRKGVLEF